MYHNLRIVYITTSTNEEAEHIGRKLVEEELAACVNIIGGMKSIYRWEGEIIEEQETVLLVKTHYSKMKPLTTRVNELHSYDCPCVISLTLTENEGNKDYIEWLLENSKESFAS